MFGGVKLTSHFLSRFLTTGVLTCNLETGPYFIDISVLVLCFSNDKVFHKIRKASAMRPSRRMWCAQPTRSWIVYRNLGLERPLFPRSMM